MIYYTLLVQFIISAPKYLGPSDNIDQQDLPIVFRPTDIRGPPIIHGKKREKMLKGKK